MTQRVATVALSGCGGLFGGGSDGGDPFAAVDLPAGTGEDGIENRTALLPAHRRTLSATDYEISFEIDVRERTRPVVRESVGTRSSLDSERAYSIVSEPGRVSEAYRNGSTTYEAAPLNGTFASEHVRLAGTEAIDIVLRNARASGPTGRSS